MVPKGWKKTHLKCVISGAIKNGYSPLPASTTTGYWVLSLGALTDHGINPLEIKPVVVDEKVKQALLSHGDFLISRSNTPDKVGRSIRFKNEVQNCSYPDLMMRFRVDTTKADPDYIEIKLKSTKVKQYYKSCAAGSSSSMVKINKAVVENTPLLLPPFPEQRKIAKILSTWDKAISTTEKLLANSQQQKKALMQQLLSGKKRIGHKTGSYVFKSTRYGLLPEEWSYPAIKDFCHQISDKNNENMDYPVLSCSKYDGFVDSLNYFNKKVYSDDLSGYRIIPRGCFGFPSNHIEEGSIGLQNLYDYGFVSPIYVVFKANTAKVNNDYLIAQLKTDHYRQIFSASTNASVDRRGSLRWKEFSAIHVPLPLLEEQNKIATVLKSAEQEIVLLKKKLDALKQEKKALMQQLLTGKRRVKVEVAA
ncbi:restriction endonuclease subunit S [Aeromonas rivipollensis]|uniref:restriction endonuclease subunit S n=1 Tax=Aeromonas rivipollensis TaxID=948519 RepID=UPI0029792507|nr:restriction endonuclease subunit S [Aeromonas rivipollensis]